MSVPHDQGKRLVPRDFLYRDDGIGPGDGTEDDPARGGVERTVDDHRTTLQAWQYTLPGFVVRFAFVLDPDGVALPLKMPKDGSWVHVAWIALTACIGIAALAAGTQK